MVKRLLCIENLLLSSSSQQLILVSGEHNEVSYTKGKIMTRGLSVCVCGGGGCDRQGRSPGRKRKMSENLRGASVSPPLNTCTILFPGQWIYLCILFSSSILSHHKNG